MRRRRDDSSSARSLAFETPTDEPMFAGFTKHGYPSVRSTSSARARRRPAPSRNEIQAARVSPAAVNARFIITLSIATAEPATPDPTYGTPASSKRPWTVPSSPYGPWSSGSTTSNVVGSSSTPGSTGTSVRLPGSGTSATGVPSTAERAGQRVARRARLARAPRRRAASAPPW